MRNNKYTKLMKDYSDNNLIQVYNKEVGNLGWGNSRAEFLEALHSELIQRDFDTSLIVTNNEMSLKRKVKLFENKIIFDDSSTLKVIEENTYTANLNIGLQNAYTNQYFDKSEYVKYLQEFQKSLIKEKNIHLSAAMTEFDLIYGDLIEKHLQFRFVNYPKFPLEKEIFVKLINDLGKSFMLKFNQNRILIEYSDVSYVFESSSEIDPKIIN